MNFNEKINKQLEKDFSFFFSNLMVFNGRKMCGRNNQEKAIFFSVHQFGLERGAQSTETISSCFHP
jgi:hypothetical protein